MNKLVAILFSLILFSAQSFADTITWCAFYNWPPWIYPSKGSYAGILIDQLEIFKKRNPDIQVEVRVIENWKRCQAEVERGRVSLILGAYKSPSREAVLHYLEETALINKSTVGVYTLEGNNKVGKVSTLDDLRNYKLGVIKGNSLGVEIDGYINSISSRRVIELSLQAQILKMTSVNRIDYFFLEVELDEAVTESIVLFPELAHVKFNKVLEIHRETPAYYVMGKNSEQYSRYSGLLISAIREYYDTVDIEAEITRHTTAAE
ncbi:transporter substrate-binding domain-containing protein [Vibrio sp. Of7-15]|uniref:substrate-binding periplasmic protein n=1 Tax=Vibrio sp. Of7-15 TaxID=2724879 RepID=UPI001EF1786A|nr:transporter substrate-binding domain-containing protein [Vibrio sp. Of7-15]MCG7499218.1 transporter substrate-binding domain-containing protein [Vibrio sp. Of7-15]